MTAHPAQQQELPQDSCCVVAAVLLLQLCCSSFSHCRPCTFTNSCNACFSWGQIRTAPSSSLCEVLLFAVRVPISSAGLHVFVQTEHQCTHGSAKDSLVGKGQEDSLVGKRQEGTLLEKRQEGNLLGQRQQGSLLVKRQEGNLLGQRQEKGNLLGKRQESRVEIAQHNSGSLHKVGHFIQQLLSSSPGQLAPNNACSGLYSLPDQLLPALYGQHNVMLL